MRLEEITAGPLNIGLGFGLLSVLPAGAVVVGVTGVDASLAGAGVEAGVL